MKRVLALIALAALAAPVALASGSIPGPLKDGRDTPGPLDLKSGVVRVAERGHRLVFTARTHDAWDANLLGSDRGLGHNFVSFEFARRTRGARTPRLPARCIDLRTNGTGEVVAELREPCGLRHTPERTITATRSDPRSVTIVISRRWLRGATHKWRATSSYEERGDAACPAPTQPPPEYRYATCFDRTHWGMLPSPRRTD